MKEKENVTNRQRAKAGMSSATPTAAPKISTPASRIPKIKPLEAVSRGGGGKANKLVPDVSVQTGLPPHVEGSLRSYLILRVSKVTWFVPRPHNDGLTMVLVKWWGEDGQGSLFIPGRYEVVEHLGIFKNICILGNA